MLLEWYDENARVLPWRSDPQPYHILVSEFMLQQTQVDTVLPYYQRFLAMWPNVQALAQADEQAVLRLWEGLGYYRRALNLHRSAKKIVARFGGVVPSAYQDLLTLPGVGLYTGAAIASIAFGKPAAAVDGNIRRVYARLFAVESALGEKETETRLQTLARESLSVARPGDFNQALMDLGAMVCLPRKALCKNCPLISLCQAYQQDKVDVLPRKIAKPRVPHYTVVAAVIQDGDRVLIAQRARDDLLGGMWEFPGGTVEISDLSLQAGLEREILEELGVLVEVGEAFGVYKHAYTHYKITLHAFLCVLKSDETLDTPRTARECENFKWVLPHQLADYPMGKVDRLIAEKLAQKRASKT